MSSKVVTLVSGGLDSCVMVSELGVESSVVPVYVQAGLQWETEEVTALHRFLATVRNERREPLRILELPVADLYGEHWSVSGDGVPGYEGSMDSNYLPGRNLLLLSKAAVLCALVGASRIALASLADNPFDDGTPEFFREFAVAAGRGLGFELAIETPFRSLSKADVIRRGQDLPLELTLSCIQPRNGIHCGDCTKCSERRVAFAESGVDDRTAYARLR